MLEKYAPLGQQRHAAGRASEELSSNFLLECSDLPANGRLSDMETLRRAPHMVLLGHCDEVSNLRQAHGVKRSVSILTYQGCTPHEIQLVLDSSKNREQEQVHAHRNPRAEAN